MLNLHFSKKKKLAEGRARSRSWPRTTRHSKTTGETQAKDGYFMGKYLDDIVCFSGSPLWSTGAPKGLLPTGEQGDKEKRYCMD